MTVVRLLQFDRWDVAVDLEPVDGARDLVAEAVALARESSLVLLFLGLPASYEAEGRDRAHIDLPADQLNLLRQVTAVNPRVVVALSNGSAVSTSAWRNSVGAVIEFWLTGQAHGDTVADVLLGDVNPSGKLARPYRSGFRTAPHTSTFPVNGHMRYSEGIHVGYRWYDARAVDVDYPFGHGLSYTTFS